jgi:diaminohydroxyphosphoribosylaminopyrimidine deaminase/5-amino-6-(5-phosphoribosylamino)uracil reductase
MDTKDEKYHRRCLELAENGLGLVAPNPMVGAVIVANDKIIGEGYHAAFGGPHAEVNAINSVSDKSLLSNAVLYVNLEPCTHFGKTPPCADLVISKQIKRVVIGNKDPFPKVSGKGIEKLTAAGIEVETGALEKECRYLNRRFLTYHEKKRPYIILKWAETSDGFIDIERKPGILNRPTWITDEATRPLVHKWRAQEQAVLIGTNTAFFDNPMLSVRYWKGSNPVRMVLDKSLRLPSALKLFDRSQSTIVFTETKSKNDVNIEYVKVNFENLLDGIFEFCYNRNIQSILVEGGTKLINTFLASDQWDEAKVFRSDMCFGRGVKAPVITELPKSSSKIGNSILYEYCRYE